MRPPLSDSLIRLFSPLRPRDQSPRQKIHKMANGQRFFLVAVLSMLTCNLLAEPFPEDAQGQLQDFCRRFGHRTAIISNRLYIDGGFVNFNPLNQNPTNYTSKIAIYCSIARKANIAVA